MCTTLAISTRLALFGVEPSLNSLLRMFNSWGDVLLLFLLASGTLSISGSCDGKVAGE